MRWRDSAVFRGDVHLTIVADELPPPGSRRAFVHTSHAFTARPCSPPAPLPRPRRRPICARRLRWQGGTHITFYGAGFYPSDGIVLRFIHSSTGEIKLVRGRHSTIEDAAGKLETVVTAEAPKFDKSAEGRVDVSLSFEVRTADVSPNAPR